MDVVVAVGAAARLLSILAAVIGAVWTVKAALRKDPREIRRIGMVASTWWIVANVCGFAASLLLEQWASLAIPVAATAALAFMLHRAIRGEAADIVRERTLQS